MSRKLAPDEARLWSVVAATVRPMPGRAPLPIPPASARAAAAAATPLHITATRTAGFSPPVKRAGPDPIEPNRKRRLERGRAPLEATLDLHGLDQDRAERVLKSFLIDGYERGLRAALIITGRGVHGDGVLRRRTPEWLGAADLRHVVAGFSQAHQKHGGDGALYVALKRKPQT